MQVLRDIERQAGSDRVLANMALARASSRLAREARREPRRTRAQRLPRRQSGARHARLPQPRRSRRHRANAPRTGHRATASRSVPMSASTLDLRLPKSVVDAAVANALAEDLGVAGDITTEATVPAGTRSSGVIAARKPGIVAGVQLAQAAFQTLDPQVTFDADRRWRPRRGRGRQSRASRAMPARC
jgi:hypothetical protein